MFYKLNHYKVWFWNPIETPQGYKHALNFMPIQGASCFNRVGLAAFHLKHQSKMCCLVDASNSWLRSSLWLQFKPHHIAAGALFLASKILNMDLCSNQSLYQEFQTTPSILEDVVQQLMELILSAGIPMI